MKQYHIYVSGLVQGIGYRSFVQNKAQDLGLAGWVRNVANGQVEIMALGRDKQLQTFISVLKKGPFLARVKEIKIEPVNPIDLSISSSFKRLATNYQAPLVKALDKKP